MSNRLPFKQLLLHYYNNITAKTNSLSQANSKRANQTVDRKWFECLNECSEVCFFLNVNICLFLIAC